MTGKKRHLVLIQGSSAQGSKQIKGERNGLDGLPLVEDAKMAGEVPKDARRKLEELRGLIRDAGEKGISYTVESTESGDVTYITGGGGQESYLKADEIIGELLLERGDTRLVLYALLRVLETEKEACPDGNTRALLGRLIFYTELKIDHLEQMEKLRGEVN